MTHTLTHALRDTLARWCRQGRSDNGETTIDDAGKRVLYEFDREIIAADAVLTVPWAPLATRAELVATCQYLRLVSSWPNPAPWPREPGDGVRADLLEPGGFASRIEGVNRPHFAFAINRVENELEDWLLCVSDGTVSPHELQKGETMLDHVALICGQGRRVFECDIDNNGLGYSFDSEIASNPPDSAGLWILHGRYYYARYGEDAEPEFEGEWRPATREDLAILGVDEWEWLTVYDTYDPARTRAVTMAIHAPGCPVHEHAKTLVIGDTAAMDYDEVAALATDMQHRLVGLCEPGECQCAQYAAHPTDADAAEFRRDASHVEDTAPTGEL